jgi:undecaprenyl-diphosphatase
MNIAQSILLGIVEGLTEFIPVSSTFHLLITAKLLGLPESDFIKLFTVVIQSGAIFSIITLYAKKLFSNRQLQQQLVLSFLPTAIIGGLLYKFIKDFFFNENLLQLAVFATVGILFLLIENLIANRVLVLTKGLTDFTIRHALLIGLFQATSIIPGVSRSGSILLGMLILGYTRRDAADYAFMLSLPTIFAATALDIYQSRSLILQTEASNMTLLVLGTGAAFFSALWVMRWLINYLSSHSLTIFGYYRLFVALVLYLML